MQISWPSVTITYMGENPLKKKKGLLAHFVGGQLIYCCWAYNNAAKHGGNVWQGSCSPYHNQDKEKEEKIDVLHSSSRAWPSDPRPTRCHLLKVLPLPNSTNWGQASNTQGLWGHFRPKQDVYLIIIDGETMKCTPSSETFSLKQLL